MNDTIDTINPDVITCEHNVPLSSCAPCSKVHQQYYAPKTMNTAASTYSLRLFQALLALNLLNTDKYTDDDKQTISAVIGDLQEVLAWLRNV